MTLYDVWVVGASGSGRRIPTPATTRLEAETHARQHLQPGERITHTVELGDFPPGGRTNRSRRIY